MYNVCPYNIYVSLYVKKQYMVNVEEYYSNLCVYCCTFFFFFLKSESNRQATDVEMRRRLIQPLCGKNSTCLCAALIERGNTPLFYIRFLPLVFLVFVSYIQCVYFVLFHPLLLLRLSRFDTTFPTENIRLT